MHVTARGPAHARACGASRLSLLLATRYLAMTMPWAVLLAGCAAGLGLALAAHQFASPARSTAGVTLGLRAGFVPVAVTVAFLAADPQRNLTATLPAPAWLSTVVHLAIALPLVGLTGYLQLELAAVPGPPPGPGPAAATLPWPGLLAEFAAWSACAVAVAAGVTRTRWRDLGGALAGPAALGLIALLAVASPGPAWSWWAVGGAAALIAGWESRDPWLRFRRWTPRVQALDASPH